MSDVVVLGTSFTSIPIIKALLKKGFTVTTVGRDRNEPGHLLSKNQIICDYADWKLLLSLLSDVEIKAIIPTCNDVSYLSAAHVASNLQIYYPDTPEIVRIMHTKEKFKALLRDLNVRTPVQYSLDDPEYPLIVKPVDSFSGKGCSVVRDKAKLKEAIEKARIVSRSGEIIAEQFIDGSLHSVSTFILEGGKRHIHFFVDEYTYTGGFSVVSSKIPSNLGRHVRLEVEHFQEKIIDGARLTNGLLHTQFLADENGAHVIETMRRAPGDLFGEQIKLVTNFDYWSAYVDGLFEKPATKNLYQKHTIRVLKSVTRNIVGAQNPVEVMSGVSIIDLGRGIEGIEYHPLKKSGESLGSLPSDKAGVLFIVYQNGEIFNVPNSSVI